MQRSHVAKDILDVIEACLIAKIGDRCREYVFGRTRGIPPADCNSVSVSWMDRGQAATFSDCKGPTPCDGWDPTLGLRIALTRVCLGPDQQPIFNWELEDAAAACFDDDLDIIEDCINCADWTQVYNDHFLDSIAYVGTTHDVEAEGGGYSAYIELTITARECCS